MQIADCVACRFGEHNEHVRDWKPVPPGVMGGARCECTGDCARRHKELAELTDALFPDPPDSAYEPLIPRSRGLLHRLRARLSSTEQGSNDGER